MCAGKEIGTSLRSIWGSLIDGWLDSDFVFFSAIFQLDGWMICDFTSFSTVFQSYLDDRRMIMKGCMQ